MEPANWAWVWSRPLQWQRSRPFSYCHLVEFPKLAVLGSTKGALLPSFPKFGQVYPCFVLVLSWVCEKCKCNHTTCKKSPLAYCWVWAGSWSSCLRLIRQDCFFYVWGTLIWGPRTLGGALLGLLGSCLPRVVPPEVPSTLGVTSKLLSKAPCLRCDTWRNSPAFSWLGTSFCWEYRASSKSNTDRLQNYDTLELRRNSLLKKLEA